MATCARRRIECAGAIALIALVAAGVTLLGQSAAPRALAGSKIPAPSGTWKTPWGDPDLQGTWSNATTTPLQRPEKYGTREFLTDEELDALRKAPRVSGLPFESYEQFWYERGDLDGRTSLVIDPPNGRIPFTPAGEKRRAAFLEENLNGPENLDLYQRCIIRLPLPRTPTAYNNTYEIVQTPGYVAILQEQIHETRVIPLDGRPHLDASVRQWLGDSRGHWEGNTLVVETRNFSDRTDFQGAGPTMTLRERWTRLTNDQIDYRFVVEDPAAWSRPWSAAIAWNRSEPIYEYACHEGNRSLYNVLEGARVQEAEEAAKKAK
jgi:hypothetical protein